MIYLYSLPDCPKCEKRKKELSNQSIEFKERDGARIKKPVDDWDDIDEDAFVQLSMQNMVFPVEVKRD